MNWSTIHPVAPKSKFVQDKQKQNMAGRQGSQNKQACTELLCRSSWGTVESVGNALGAGKIRVRPVNVSKAAKMREGCTEWLCRSSRRTVESVDNPLSVGKISVRPVNVSNAPKMGDGCTELLCRSSWETVESVANALDPRKI